MRLLQLFMIIINQKDIYINVDYKEESKKELGETISRKKMFGERFVKKIKINAK